MPYYNEKRIEVPEHYQGIKWVVEDRHKLNPQNGELVVYGKQGWELIQESFLEEFLVNVGVIKLESHQEIKNGKIVTKPPTEQDMKKNRLQEIDNRLNQIDYESIRPLRAKLSGNHTEYDDDKLTALEAEATNLRKERNAAK
jgi:hypothetical protein